MSRLSSDPATASFAPLLAQMAEKLEDGSDRSSQQLQTILDSADRQPPNLQVVVDLLSRRFADMEEGHMHEARFWDARLRTAVSFYDKMCGSHATGANSTNKLVPIAEAYDRAAQESFKDDPLLLARRQAIASQLSAVDERIGAVRSQAAEVEEHLYALLHNAMRELQDRTNDKLNELTSSRVELRRQMQYVQWMEGFLQYEREHMSKLDFLRAYERHLALRAEVHGMADVRQEIAVRPDLVIAGRLEVLSQAELEAREHDAGFGPYGGGGGGGGDLYGMAEHGGAGDLSHAGGGAEHGMMMNDSRSQLSRSGMPDMATAAAPRGLALAPGANPLASFQSAASGGGRALPAGSASAAGELPEDSTQLRSTSDYWVEVLRKNRNDAATRQRYEQLLQTLVASNMCVAFAVVGEVDKEEYESMGRALFTCMEASGGSLPLLRGLLQREVQMASSVQLLLRESTFATKLINNYMLVVGTDYLRSTLGPMINMLCENAMVFEVDPARAPPGTDFKQNLRTLTNTTQMFMEKITQNIGSIPVQIRILCSQIAQASRERFPGQHLVGVASLFFLRFICPALLMPDVYSVCDVVPTEATRRSLVLVAKVVQKLGSRTTFKKEPYLNDLNPYISANLDNVGGFLERISNAASLPAPDKVAPLQVAADEKHDALVMMHRFLGANLDGVSKAAQNGIFAEPAAAAGVVDQLHSLLAQLGVAPQRPESYVQAEAEMARRQANLANVPPLGSL